MTDDRDPEGGAPKGGLGIVFTAAAIGLAMLLTIIGAIAYLAMRP